MKIEILFKVTSQIKGSIQTLILNVKYNLKFKTISQHICYIWDSIWENEKNIIMLFKNEKMLLGL